MKNISHILFFLILSLTCSCQKQNTETSNIGVSLCNDDIWHQSVISELRYEAQFYKDIALDIQSNKNGDDAQQIKIIESFIEQKKDLIIISAGNATALTPIVEKAFKAEIPIIILDQRIESDLYSAYVGGDNYNIGKQVALYIVKQLNAHGNIVELRGRTESLTDIERHRGFKDVLVKYPNIKVIAEEKANFDTTQAEQKMTDIIQTNQAIDIIFAMDDLTAKGVYNAYQKAQIPQPFTIGIDAVAGKEGGMDNVSKGYQDISFIYPTGANKALEVAHQILHKKPFQRENILHTGIIDKSNVALMLKEKEHLFAQQHKAGLINTELAQSRNEYSNQRSILLFSIGLIGITLLLLILSIKAYFKKHKITVDLREKYRMIEEEHAKAILKNTEIQRQLDVLSQPEKTDELTDDQKYIRIFRTYVSEHIADSSLDVERLAELYNESYTQMYRKIKTTTGYTPTEFIRLIRLTYAKQLLSTGSMSISTIAYESGFSSPSYFTRCFKAYYKKSPKEYLKSVDS